MKCLLIKSCCIATTIILLVILRPDAGFPSMFEEYVRSFLSGLETELIKSLGKYYKHMDYKY